MDIEKFIKEISWPVVTLICVYYLFHKGQLKEIFRIIAENIIDLGKTLRSIKDESDKMSGSVESFNNAVSTLSSKLDELNDKVNSVKDTAEKVDVNVTEISEIQDENIDISHSNDAVYKSIMTEWNEFVEGMSSVFSETGGFDRRSIGAMASLLSDKRFKHKISISKGQAEEIGALFSKIKATRRYWKSIKDKKNEAASLISEIQKAKNWIDPNKGKSSRAREPAVIETE